MKKRILVVDDSMYMRTMIDETLTEAGFEIVGQAANGEDAIDLALELEPDLITLDNILPDMIGIDILKILKVDEELSSKIIMVSAVGQETVINEGMKLGASDYIVKPFSPEFLLDSVQKAFEKDA